VAAWLETVAKSGAAREPLESTCVVASVFIKNIAENWSTEMATISLGASARTGAAGCALVEEGEQATRLARQAKASLRTSLSPSS
jgi:hypothetical protein